MKNLYMTGLLAALVFIAGCAGEDDHAGDGESHSDAEHSEAEMEQVAKGTHGGRLLIDGDFAVELAIFETGVPPEFRAWVNHGGEMLSPAAVDLEVTLSRLGGVTDEIDFRAQDDYLRGEGVIYEPHSFVVTVDARHRDKRYRWEYDSIEGRTRIDADMAEAFGLETANAGPATLHKTVTSYGRVGVDQERLRLLSARYAGTIMSVEVSVGEQVSKGQKLATVQSNDSLTAYDIEAPIDGVVTRRFGNPGEQTSVGPILELLDATSVWVDLAVFPSHIAEVRKGAPVAIANQEGNLQRSGVIDYIEPVARADQSVIARVTLSNSDGALYPGMFVTGTIEVNTFDVPLAVKRIGLQGYRDFTVVYAQIGDEFEVRMLDLGRQDGEWAEVLGGLDPGTRYVTRNSFLVKADIEKSGASHDH